MVVTLQVTCTPCIPSQKMVDAGRMRHQPTGGPAGRPRNCSSCVRVTYVLIMCGFGSHANDRCIDPAYVSVPRSVSALLYCMWSWLRGGAGGVESSSVQIQCCTLLTVSRVCTSMDMNDTWYWTGLLSRCTVVQRSTMRCFALWRCCSVCWLVAWSCISHHCALPSCDCTAWSWPCSLVGSSTAGSWSALPHQTLCNHLRNLKQRWSLAAF